MLCQSSMRRRLLPACFLFAFSLAAQAGYNTCGTSIVSSTTRTCSDGTIAMYHSGDPLTLSASSIDFGNIEVGQSASRSLTLSNSSGYSLGFSGSITISSAFLTGSSTTCGQTLATGSSCTVTVKFAPSSTGAVSGQIQIPTAASATPYSVTLKGTGIVTTTTTTPTTGSGTTGTSGTSGSTGSGTSTGTTSGSSGGTSTSTSGSTSGSGTSTSGGTSTTSTSSSGGHATKTTPTSCISYIGGTTLGVPYFTLNGNPMWAEFTSNGTLLSYKLSDYGALTTAGSATCAADGGALDIAKATTLSLPHLYYNGSYYTATLQLVGADKDGKLLFDIVAADTYRSNTSSTAGSGSSTGGGLDHSILVGDWAQHYGVSTVTFKSDGTYASANGGTGTYRWDGDRLFVTGALTSGRDLEVSLEVTASATWLHVDLDVSGYTVRTDYYKMK